MPYDNAPIEDWPDLRDQYGIIHVVPVHILVISAKAVTDYTDFATQLNYGSGLVIRCRFRVSDAIYGRSVHLGALQAT